MNRFKPLQLSAIALSMLVGIGCRTHGDVTVIGPNALGSLAGIITTIIDSTGRFIQDRSGIVVTLDNNVASDTTSTAGQWRIDNILIGLHNLTFSRSGFPSQRLNFIYVVGGTTTDLSNRVAITAPPSFTITLAAVTLPTPQQAGKLYGSVSGSVVPGYSINLLVLRSRHDHPTIDDPASFDTSYTIQVTPQSNQSSETSFTTSLAYSGPTYAGTAPGDKIVLRVYPYFAINRLPDEAGSMHITGLGKPSNEISFVRN